jgi:hypothetical protein
MAIEDEVAAVKAAAAKKLRLLRDRERKQQQAVDTRMLMLMRDEHPGPAAQLEVEARAQLAAESAQRSTRARASRGVPPHAAQSDVGGTAADRVPACVRFLSEFLCFRTGGSRAYERPFPAACSGAEGPADRHAVQRS